MKKVRIFAFLCVLVLIFGSLSSASANSTLSMKGADNKAIAYLSDMDFYTLKNGKSVKVLILPDANTLYIKDYIYNVILFDCEGPVKAKCNASWVHITNKNENFNLSFDINNSNKSRTATITVTGKNYKAKLKITQFGRGKFTKVLREKKTVTMNIKMPKGSKGGRVEIYAYDNKGENTKKTIKIKPGKASLKLKYKVKQDRSYSIYLCTYYKITAKETAEWDTDYVVFEVTAENIDATETYHSEW